MKKIAWFLCCFVLQLGLLQSFGLPGLSRDVYRNIPGMTLGDLESSPKFPDAPDEHSVIANFETPFMEGDNYGQRVRGYVVPPETGLYHFHLASDDQGILYLSSDESPSNKAPIAMVNSWVGVREYHSGRPEEPNQVSAAIPLEAGKKYYIEALTKEGGGGDHLSVAWRIPGTAEVMNGGEPIAGQHLLTYSDDPNASLVYISQPLNGATFNAPARVLIVAQPSGSPSDISKVEFFGDGIRLGTRTNLPTADPIGPFKLEWVNPAVGDHVVIAVATSYQGSRSTSAPVRFSMQQESLPTVSIRALDSEASEPGQNRAILEITRSGSSLERDLHVYYRVSGTATSGSDYVSLGSSALIPAGRSNVVINVTPIDDLVSEPAENVVVTLIQPEVVIAIYPPPPPPYVIGTPASAEVWIADNDSTPIPGRGLLREFFSDIPGNYLSNLFDHPSYPNSPSQVSVIEDFETPSNVTDSYGQRLRGYLHPPVTGFYTLYLASDDQGLLFLSTDETPAAKREIASVLAWRGARQWVAPGPPFDTNNVSEPIFLEGGRRYYVEAAMKEGGGGDNLAVTWRLPEGPEVLDGDPPIPGDYLSPFRNLPETNRVPVVTITAPTPATDEGSERPGVFRISRSLVTTNPLTVLTVVSGTASNGVDYRSIGLNHQIPANQAHVEVPIRALMDSIAEPTETVVLRIVPAFNYPTATDSSIQVRPQPYTIGSNHLATVSIRNMGGPTNPPPLVWITTVDASAGENPFNPGKFRFWRNGPTNTHLAVYYRLTGSASNGVDYALRHGQITLPNGASHADLNIEPINDMLVEGTETVRVHLLYPGGVGEIPPISAQYVFSNSVINEITILDDDLSRTSVEFINPTNNQTFHFGESIEVRARVVGLPPTYVWLYADETNLLTQGPLIGTNVFFNYNWSNAPVGLHTLKLRVESGLGEKATASVQVVINRHSRPLAVRELPEFYTPGNDLTVVIEADAPDHAAAWALEDRLPAGWLLTGVSDGGVFDAVTRKVKFGPFFETSARRLTYTVRSPSNALHTAFFEGIISIDGVNTLIGGDRLVQPRPFHPADRNPQDWRIVASELTAYSAQWKRLTEMPKVGASIPISFVTRAAFLWKSGEQYTVDPRVAEAPLWWVPAAASPSPGLTSLSSTGSDSTAVSSIPSNSAPGISLSVNVRIVPAVGVKAYAVEDRPAFGWTASNISHDGLFDPVDKKVKWGPFLDNVAREFSYSVNPSLDVSGSGTFSGTASFDGLNVPITGARIVGSGNGGSTNTASGVRWHPNGGAWLMFPGESGIQYLLECSTNLVDWNLLGRTYSTNGAIRWFDEGVAGEKSRFYRARRDDE